MIYKQTQVVAIIKLFCTLAACVVWTHGVLAKDLKTKKLYQVKTIWIEPINDREKLQTIEKCLQKELEKRGFKVVGERAAANAILKGAIKILIVLDGDPEDASKVIYEFQLLMSGETIWKARVKFRSKPTFAENNEYASIKLAERLQRDWRKSARQADSR